MRVTGIVLCAAAAAAAFETPIKNVVVLMFENRAFDHLLGHLSLLDPRIDGLPPGASQPVDPSDPSSPRVPILYDAPDGGPVDPLHDFDSVTMQIFGFQKPMGNKTAPPRMNGFLGTSQGNETGAAAFITSAFNASSLPVFTTLALEFAVADAWHCSVPGPTNPNREFLMSGTSHGKTVNSFPDAGFPQQTHFTFLEERNVSWKIYYADDPWMAPAFAELRTPAALANIQEMPLFYSALEAGTLPRYSLIQPRMASSATGPANWIHADSSVASGETLLATVYAALKASVHWNDTLFVVTFDEHGGFPDHVPTPTAGVPAPDDVPGDNGFDFTRLGVRIPTLLISPWIARGTVLHAPSGARAPTPTSQFDATSIIASANRIFGIRDNMTKRDAWAGTFHDLVAAAPGARPRDDCPSALAPLPQPSGEALLREAALPLGDHHWDSINLLCTLAAHAHAACAGYGATPARAARQAAYVAELAADTFGAARMPAAGEWPVAAAYPHMHAPAARLLRQGHFGDISAALYKVYTRAVMAAA